MVLPHPLRVRTAEGLRDDTHAEVLSGFGNAGHDGLGVPADIHLFEVMEAVVAGAASVRRVLAEVVQDILPQTPACPAVAGHLPQPLQVPLPQLLGRPGIQVLPGLAVGDEKLISPHILATVQQDAAGGRPVPARPARLLVVALHVLGHIVVDDIPDIGLVDAHAEGVGGHHHLHPVVEEVLLVPLPLLWGQASVIPGGGYPPLAEEVAHLLHILPGGTVDDAALAGAALHQLQQRRPLVRRLLDLKIQVLPVKAGGQLQRVLQVQQAVDVRLHVRRGGGGEGSHRGPVGQALHKGGDVQVGGPEILAPLGDAVGLVHRHQGDVCLPHKGLEALGLQPLRGHVDDLVPPRPGPVQGQQILAEG